MNVNPLTSTDFYKADHRRQYPAGTTLVYSNLTPRSDKLSPIPKHLSDGKVVSFGLGFFLQDFLVDRWNRGFFALPRHKVVADYKRRMDLALGKDAINTDHIGTLHDLGYLPICIKALPEGTVSPIGCPVLVIYNTHPDFFWLTNYLETALSAYLWKPMTSATVARAYRRLLDRYAAQTGTPADFVPFQGHDFSARGMSGIQDGALSGAAHLASFIGTDSVAAIDLAEFFYEAGKDGDMIGCSVPASEHSCMCMGGQDDEIGTFRRFITELYPKGIVSIVADTWDFWRVVTEYVATLKPEIMARDGKLVIRPDSGDPVKIICGEAIPLSLVCRRAGIVDRPCWASARAVVDQGYRYFTHNDEYYVVKPDGPDDSLVWHTVKPTPEMLGAVRCLWEVFGGTTTPTGHRMLDSHIGLIYGDSITLERAESILSMLDAMGFASGNIVLGIGSFTYQHVTRDSFGFAVKSTYGEVNGIGRDIFKKPKTDSGTKNSLKGRIAVYRGGNMGELFARDEQPDINMPGCQLREVFRDGKILSSSKFAEIRERIKRG